MWFKHTLSMVAVLLLGTLSQIHLVNAQAGEPITSSPVPVPAGTSCTQPRIRRSWELYSEADKALYIKAVGIAMTQGLHQKMVELHTEWFSELEAHKNCMFIYWHRMYLLGYENMLRSLGPEYQCITLPYWDHLASTARRSVGLCSNLEDCSPVIKSFGGSSIGPLQSLTVYNQTILRPRNGVCVNQSMLVNFCGNTTTKVCAKCVVRGPVKSKTYPAEAFFGAVYQQVFQYSDWSNFATAVERGVHNMIHGAIGGVMTYFQSPTDPIFYSHHGFIDALQTIYLKCQIGGEQFITPSSLKGTDPRWFTNCPRRNAGIFHASDNITMNVRDYSMKTWGNVRTMVKSILYPYFKDLPATFGDYVDAKDIGAYSYTYEFSGALSNMYINCKDSVSMSASQSVAASPPTTTSGIMFLAQLQQSSPGHGILTPVIFGATTYETRMRRWTIAMFEAAKIAGYTVPGAKDQMEMILCVHKQECLGGVEDFDPVFRKNFGVTGHARCFTILQYLQQGKRIIGVPGWREMTSKFLPCPSRKEPNVQMA